MIDTTVLIKYAREYGIELDENMSNAFLLYADMLLDWNQRINLTAITSPDEIVIKHFLDSLTIIPYILEQNISLIDVGSGAGFPGVPLKIVRPDINLTLLDSSRKRVDFLQALSDKLEMDNTCLHNRAEDYARTTGRERYDYVVARAVAPLAKLCEYCIPFVNVGGCFLACKGPGIEDEVSQSENTIAILGGRLQKSASFELPDGSHRCIIVIKKISQTPTQYPRNAAKILKIPLK